MIERYAAWCHTLAVGIEEVAPTGYTGHAYAGVGVTAGMDLGMTFALAHPALARRLVELCADAGLMVGDGQAEKVKALRQLARIVGGDA